MVTYNIPVASWKQIIKADKNEMGSQSDKTQHKNIRVITKHLNDCMQQMLNSLKTF